MYWCRKNYTIIVSIVFTKSNQCICNCNGHLLSFDQNWNPMGILTYIHCQIPTYSCSVCTSIFNFYLVHCNRYLTIAITERTSCTKEFQFCTHMKFLMIFFMYTSTHSQQPCAPLRKRGAYYECIVICKRNKVLIVNLRKKM